VLDEDELGNDRAHASGTKLAKKRRDEMDKKDDDLAHHGIINNIAKSAKLGAKQQFARDRWRDYRFEIDYDPVVGYPIRVYFKRFPNAADDDYSMTIGGFKTLVK